MKQSQLDRAIDALEDEKAVLELAIAKLKQQKQEQRKAIAAKLTVKGAA